MKKIIFAVLIAVIFCLSSCGNGTTGGEESPFEGTWRYWKTPTSTDMQYIFSGDKFEQTWDGIKITGTFTYDDTNINLIYTRIWDDPSDSDGREGYESVVKKYLFIDGNLVFPAPTNLNDHGETYVRIK